MPLYADAERLIRGNFSILKKGRKPRAVPIGILSPEQLDSINSDRSSKSLPPIEAEIYFVGKHMYESRVERDGYTEDDLTAFVLMALAGDYRIVPGVSRTILKCATTRMDRNGRRVRDEMVLELTARHPYPELLSVIPRGDGLKTKKGYPEGSPFKK